MVGDVNGRICALENETQSFAKTAVVDELRRNDVAREKEFQDMKAKLDVLIVGFQSMQNQINVLASRP